MMKKLVSILFLAAMLLTGCSTTAETPEAEHTRYVASGRYYTDGTVITNDGHIWSYDQETISEEPSYNHEPVYVGFDDNGTPDDITDDIILGLVRDIETSIYDALEDTLSEKFELEREGNHIRIHQLTEKE